MLFSRAVVLNTIWSFLDRFSSIGGHFINTLIVARALDPEQFGQLYYGVAITALLVPLITLGTDTLLLNSLSKRSENQTSVLSTVFCCAWQVLPV